MSSSTPTPTAARESAALSVSQAHAAITAAITPITGDETLPLAQALGRVLAADLPSPMAVPAHDNAAMDGYAFASSLLREGRPLVLPVAGTVFAGRPFKGPVPAGQAMRIMTGAVMPPGCDTVVPQEQVEVSAGQVHVPAGAVRRGDNRRQRGEDLAPGQTALHAGRVLRPADLGLAASLGLQALTVRRRLRVALFSTGDELRQPGEALPPGCIYDSNRSSLGAALQRLGMVDVIDLGLVPDDPAALQDTLQRACTEADAVLTSGGVSEGDADHTRTLLARLGDVQFWQVAMRPGRPFAFGPLHHGSEPPRCLFALPGNPVAALVAFYALARDGLLRLAGARPEALPLLRVPSPQAIRKRPGRTEFQRARVSPGPGGWQVQLTGPQGSGLLHSMSVANALLVLDETRGPVAAGEMVDVWLFDGLV